MRTDEDGRKTGREVSHSGHRRRAGTPPSRFFWLWADFYMETDDFKVDGRQKSGNVSRTGNDRFGSIRI